jgi:hypothetical protein
MFGLLDDIDRQDVKDFLNSAVDNTADLYDTVTEYDYSNMFDDIGDYFSGLLSDEPASPMSSQMGAAFGSRGGGRVMSPTAKREKNIERLLQERQGLYSMGGEPQSIKKTTVSVSPGTQPMMTTNRPKLMGVLESINEEYKPLSGPSTQPMMMPQRIKDAEMRRRGAEDIRLQYPEFDMMMQMNRPRRSTVAPAEEAVINPGGYKTLEERDDAYSLPEYLRRRVRDQVRNDNRLSTAQAAADARIGNSVRQRYMPSINPEPNSFPLL